MKTDKYFNATCEVFDLQNCPGISGLIMDPCNCSNYYQCGQKELIHRQCEQAFNFKLGVCDYADIVFQQQECGGSKNPWDRCGNATDTRLWELQNICLNSRLTTEISKQTTTTEAALTDSNPSAGVNPGIVIGAIIAGSVFTAIIFLAIVMYRRKQKSKLPKSTRSPSGAPEYHEAENPEDPYSVINDANIANIVNNPTYTKIQTTNGPTTSSGIPTHHQNGALSDNSGVREVNVCHTLRLTSDGYEIPRTSVADSTTRTSDLYSKTHKKLENPDTEGNIGFALGADSPPIQNEMSEGIGGDHETHPVYFEPQPDYFVLEKVDHCCDQTQ